MRHAEGRRGMGGEAAAVRPWAQIVGYSAHQDSGLRSAYCGLEEELGLTRACARTAALVARARAVLPAARGSPWVEPCRGSACSRTTLSQIGGFRPGTNPAVPSILARLCVRSQRRARRGSQLQRVPQWSY